MNIDEIHKRDRRVRQYSRTTEELSRMTNKDFVKALTEAKKIVEGKPKVSLTNADMTYTVLK